MDLERIGTEERVGDFRADIFAKELEYGKDGSSSRISLKSPTTSILAKSLRTQPEKKPDASYGL